MWYLKDGFQLGDLEMVRNNSSLKRQVNYIGEGGNQLFVARFEGRGWYGIEGTGLDWIVLYQFQ